MDASRAAGVLLATGVALSLVFTGLAFVLALGFQDRAAGLAARDPRLARPRRCLYDGLVLDGVVLLRDYPLERPLLAVMLFNPVDLARVLLLLQFDLGALAGYTGAIFERFFGTVQGSLWSAAALAAWIAVPIRRRAAPVRTQGLLSFGSTPTSFSVKSSHRRGRRVAEVRQGGISSIRLLHWAGCTPAMGGVRIMTGSAGNPDFAVASLISLR